MKPAFLGLIVSAAAFAGSTYYFWQQLQIERERAEQVAAQSESLKQRIAELEQARDDLGSFEFAGPESGAKGDHALAKSAALPPGPAPKAAATREPQIGFQTRPEPSPAMRKMMRAQLRSNNKRLYGDLVAQMGLSEDDANKFYDLMTNQQAVNFGQMRGLEADEARAKALQERKQSEDAIENLLGADKVATLKDYQETMGVRAEVDMIARQLEAMENSLSADQRKKLVTAMIEEQKRVPQPEYSSFGDRELYNKALTDWQAQYNDRATDRARSILNSEQMSSYNEYQQWQTEMRDNFRTAPGGRRLRGGNAVTLTTSPAFIGPVTVPAPPPDKE
ncbi:MAG: hypothetical protein H7Y89_11745 [Steroidobacteraceae bacterium]|nr:hypothetical protein [Steroidobacteraceae bacterium]